LLQLKVRGCQDQICSGLTHEFVNVVHIKAQESNCGRDDAPPIVGLTISFCCQACFADSPHSVTLQPFRASGRAGPG
jgi:hypothetical protein